MVSVHAPVDGFNGSSAGHTFVDGVAEVDEGDTAALCYFADAGYGIGGPATPADAEPQPDVRDLGDGVSKVGSPLHDAQWDNPEPEPEPDDDDLDQLRADAAELGIEVNPRWREKRLREEIDARLADEADDDEGGEG